jgi:hypothetical protein
LETPGGFLTIPKDIIAVSDEELIIKMSTKTDVSGVKLCEVNTNRAVSVPMTLALAPIAASPPSAAPKSADILEYDIYRGIEVVPSALWFQAVVDDSGTAVGGKPNMTLNKIEAKVYGNNTYAVKATPKNFSDIADKSREMREAIGILASKNIILGTSPDTFAPDDNITRAEIAALIVRILSKLNPNEDGKFIDVKNTDWFFGSVGSAKKYNIINGTSPTTFSPLANIQKDQIVAMAARTLRSEMNYRDPIDVEAYLSGYKDRNALPTWGLTDFALAARENLVIERTDGLFAPLDAMTRGDAAITLYRMFLKIW